MDSDNSESGKEEEDDDDDSKKTQTEQMLDHQRTYLQMCQTSAKIMQVLAGLGAHQTTHVIELESISDDSEVSSCSSPESMSQTPNTEDASRPDSECVIWAEPLMTCQIVAPAKQPCRDVRRLPPGVTPDDVRRSKAEAEKTRAAVKASIEVEDKKKQSERGQSSSVQNPNSSGQAAKFSGSSGTSNSSMKAPESSPANTKTNNSNSGIDPVLFRKTVTANQVAADPSVDTVSSSIAATREDFKRAMTQISSASETIRQAHSLLTSMGLGHYSIRRRLSQMNNNNSPSIDDQTDGTEHLQQEISSTPEQASSMGIQIHTVTEEQSETETQTDNAVGKEASNEATGELTSTLPSVVMVKPAQSGDGNIRDGSNISPKDSGSKGSAVSNGSEKPSGTKGLQSSLPNAHKLSTCSKSLTGSQEAGETGSPSTINACANFRQVRDACSSTDSWTKWSSHLQPQRRLVQNQAARVTRFTNRFQGQPQFGRNAPTLSRTEETTVLANNVEKSSISPVDDPSKENSNCCNRSSNAYCLPTGMVPDGISKKQEHKAVDDKGTTGKGQSKCHNKSKRKITVDEVKDAVEFAVGNLKKSGKWTESWDDVINPETELNLVVDLNAVRKDNGIGSEKSNINVNGTAKRVTFVHEPVVITDGLKEVSKTMIEDEISETDTTTLCVVSEDFSNESCANFQHIDMLTAGENSSNNTLARIDNLSAPIQARDTYQVSNANTYSNYSNNKEINNCSKAKFVEQSSQHQLSPEQSKVREGMDDTPESAVAITKKSYFDRLKEICDSQSLTKTADDIDNTRNNMKSECDKQTLVQSLCGEYQEKNAVSLKSPNMLNEKANEISKCQYPEAVSQALNRNCQISSKDISESIIGNKLMPEDKGKQSVVVAEKWNNVPTAAGNDSVDVSANEVQQLVAKNTKQDSGHKNFKPENLCTDDEKKVKQMKLNQVVEIEPSDTIKCFDIETESTDNGSGLESSAAAIVTITNSSPTLDHVFDLAEDGAEIAAVKQCNTTANIQPVKNKDDASVGSKSGTKVSPQSSTTGEDTNNFPSNNDTDMSITLLNEEPYKPSFFASPSSSNEVNEPTLSSSDSDRPSAIFTCKPSLNPHHSLSAGDMCTEKNQMQQAYRSDARSISPLHSSIFVNSALHRYGKKRFGNKYLRSKFHNARPFLDGTVAANDSLFDNEKSKLAYIPQICDIGHQKQSKSAGNSPRYPGHTVTSKWNKPAKLQATTDVLTTHSSVSVIELMEEHKPEPLILPEPSLSKDPFGIRQGAKVNIFNEKNPDLKGKLNTGTATPDSDEDLTEGEGVNKFSPWSLFQRPRRLRFRRRRRRFRQRSSSWWTRSLQCIRSKLRSLFSRCLNQQ